MAKLVERRPQLIDIDGFVELDGHDGAAGEVDPRVQPTGQRERDDARHQKRGREQIEVQPMANEIKHGCLTPRARDGWPTRGGGHTANLVWRDVHPEHAWTVRPALR